MWAKSKLRDRVRQKLPLAFFLDKQIIMVNIQTMLSFVLKSLLCENVSPLWIELRNLLLREFEDDPSLSGFKCLAFVKQTTWKIGKNAAKMKLLLPTSTSLLGLALFTFVYKHLRVVLSQILIWLGKMRFWPPSQKHHGTQWNIFKAWAHVKTMAVIDKWAHTKQKL